MAVNEIKKEKSAEAICRLCFEEREHYQYIFIDDYCSLGAWIESLTTLKITKIANAPASLCSECENILRNFESFREMCFTNNRIFQEMQTQNNSKNNGNEVKEDLSENQEAGRTEVPQMCNTEITIDYPNIKTEEKNEGDQSENESFSDTADITAADNDESLGGIVVGRQKSHKCSFCDKAFMNSNRLEIHIRSHTQERPHKCENCDKSFITSSSLKRHSRSHSGLKPYSCDRCPAKYNQSSHLVRHQSVHQEEDYIKHKQYIEVLESTSHDTGQVQEYEGDQLQTESVSANGDKDKRKLCTICNKKVHRLTQHLFVHNQIRPYQCEICSMGFTQMYKLIIHKRKHTKEKPFVCTQCDKGFTCTADLKVHIRSHTQERPFKCKLCDKAFITSGHLLRHTQTHSGLKPFPCDLCPANFAQKCHLERHKKVHEKLMCPRIPTQEVFP